MFQAVTSPAPPLYAIGRCGSRRRAEALRKLQAPLLEALLLARENLRQATLQAIEPFALAGEPGLGLLRRKAPRECGKCELAFAEHRLTRPVALEDREVEPLPRRFDQPLGIRQGAQQTREVAPGAIPQAQNLPGESHTAIAHSMEQIGPDRHDHLGSGGGRRRTHIRDLIEKGPIRLVADGRDERDFAHRGGAHHDFLVEAPEILQRAATARDDEHIGTGNAPARLDFVEAADGSCHFLRRAIALHAHGPDQHFPREAIAQPVDHVANHRARGRCHDADHLRQVGQKLLARGFEQALRRELAARSSSRAMSAPTPAGSIASTTIW